MEMIHKLNETRHLECSHCSYRGSDYESSQIHMGTVHPEYCDEMDTAGLGKLIFYQKSAKLFHCYKCFFTSKMFCNVYYHITASHALPDELANEKNNMLSANIEQNGNTKSDDNKPVVESSEDEKSLDDVSECDEKKQLTLPVKPEEKDLLTSFPEKMIPKEEEISDADSNSCTFGKKGMNLVESKGKVSNSDEEQLDFESSDNSSTYPAENKAETSSAQVKHIPEFSDDEETPALPKDIMEFSDNEETPELPKEIMDFSDGEDTTALPKEIMDFSDNEDSALPKEMMEFSDNEDTPALPEDIMEFSDGEETPVLAKAMEFSDNEESSAVVKDKTELSDEEIPTQSRDVPEFSDDEETPALPNDVPDFSDDEETPAVSKNIPEFSDEEETPALSKDIPESSDEEENTAQSKERPDFSDDSTTALSKDVPEFSDNEDTSTQSKDVPEFSDNEDTSTQSKGMMDFSDTEDIPTLSKDIEFSDNEENSRPKDTMVFSNLKETPIRPKGIISFSDNEETPARPKGIMEFSDDEEMTAFSKDLPKFSESSITPTTPTHSDDVPEFSHNLKSSDSEQLKNMLEIANRDMTPTRTNKTISFTDDTASPQSISTTELQTPVRSKSIMEFSEDEDTPARSNDELKSPEGMTPIESKDGESSEEKESLTQEETMLKYLRRGKGKYYCLMCECRPMRKGAVLHHLVGKHNIPSPYQCKECGKNFVLENVYKNHLMSHTEGLYKCTRCSFETNHPRGFKKHQTHCQNRHSEGANKKLWEFQDNEREKENAADNTEESSKDNTEENSEDKNLRSDS